MARNSTPDSFLTDRPDRGRGLVRGAAHQAGGGGPAEVRRQHPLQEEAPEQPEEDPERKKRRLKDSTLDERDNAIEAVLLRAAVAEARQTVAPLSDHTPDGH